MIVKTKNRAADTNAVVAEKLHYSLIIEWDPRGDGVYVVTVPELPGCRTHGATYAEAVAQAAEAIESWVEGAIGDGETPPSPHHYADRDWENY